MQIWQSPAWPNFTHDPARTEAPLAAFRPGWARSAACMQR